MAGKPEEALSIYAMRRDGLPSDVSCFTAYQGGRKAAAAAEGPRAHARGDRRRNGPRFLAAGQEMLRNGYEKLLLMECCPERIEGPLLDRIRIITN